MSFSRGVRRLHGYGLDGGVDCNLSKCTVTQQWWGWLIHQRATQPSRGTSAGWRCGLAWISWCSAGAVWSPVLGKEQPWAPVHPARKQLCRKGPGVLIGTKLYISQQCALAIKKVSVILGCIRQSFCQQVKKDHLIFLFSELVRLHLKYCIQSWAPLYKRKLYILERALHRAQMIRGLKCLSCEERLRE